MASQPPEPGTADLSGTQIPAAGHSLIRRETPSSHTTKRGAKRNSDSRVVVIPSMPGEGIMPGDVLPDEKTVISAAKSNPPLPELPLQLGAKHAAQHLGETLVGRRLEHYELVEFVGGGGMGAVFRATDTRLGRTVAVKVLSRDQSSEENVRRFRNEAQSAARLDHRYIARVHYVGEDAGLNFIVFEFIEGINLRELVQQKGPLPLDEALRYTREVGEALAHASQRDVVHRDIKPSNVLVTPEGQIKVVDMGLARLHQVDSSFDDLTASGVTLGTFDYISPEQARDPRAADVRSDIYSLGCTLYFMLTGKPPFPDGSALQKLLRHNGVDPPDVRLFRPELPPAIGPLLGKMLAKRPVQRQQSAEELVAEVERIARDLGYDIGSAGSEATLASPAQQRVWANWVATIVAPIVVLAMALVALEYLSPQSISEVRFQLRPAAGSVPNEGPQPVSPKRNSETPLPDPDASDPPPEPPNPTNSNATDPRPMPVERTPMANSEGIAALIDNPPPVGPPPDTVASRNSPAVSSPAETLVTPPKPPSPKIIVRRNASSNPDVDVVGSLSQAIRRAADRGGITEVELDVDGDLVEHPFEVSASRMLIHPAQGRKPRIVFRPADAADQRQMIHLLTSGARLAFQDLDIRMELPDQPSDGWTVFALHQAQSLELSNCVITVVDYVASPGSTSGISVHDQVSVVQLLTRRLPEMMKMEEEMAMMAPVTINVSRCLVRGETNLLAMPDELPVKLNWNEGLFASSKRLVESGGAMSKPRSLERIELVLNQVTIAARQGLFLMKRRNNETINHHIRLEVTSDECIFAVGTDAPLFELVGMPNVEDFSFVFGGSDNCYPREEMIFLRSKTTGAGEGTLDYNLENRSRWAGSERSPDLGVIWRSPPIDVPPHAQTAEHYQLSETSPHSAGFKPDEIPRPAEPAAKVLKPAVDSAPDAAAPAVTPAADSADPATPTAPDSE